MPLLNTCCCFKSIRNGCFASAIYTMVFYVILMTACTFHIHTVYDHLEMLVFTLILVCLSALMVITSILLLIGLCADNGHLFVPWMVTITLTTLSDVLLSIYLLCNSTIDPFKAVIYIMDFFIIGVNVYCFLCVYSYYKKCVREMLHLKYLAPQQNAQNNFTDLKKYDGSNHSDSANLKLNDQKYKYSLEEHLAHKNSHFVELSTISEDNEQISIERNTTGANGEILHMIATDFVSDYRSDSSQMVTLLTCIESGLVTPISSITRMDEKSIDVNKLTIRNESVV